MAVEFTTKQRVIIAKTIALTVTASIEALGHKVNRKQLPNIFDNILGNISGDKMIDMASKYDKEVTPKKSKKYTKVPAMKSV